MSMLMQDVYVIEVHRRGLPGDGATVGEVAGWRADVDAWQSTLDTFGLDDLSNVNAATPTPGDALVWDGAVWAPSVIQGGINRVSYKGDSRPTNTTVIDFWDGFSVETLTGDFANWARVKMNLAGSGMSERPARSDHVHTTPSTVREDILPAGYMSGGTRSWSRSVALLNNITYHVRARLKIQIRGGDPGACYYTTNVTIAGNSRTSPGGESGFWAVQGVPREQTWEYEWTMTGSGTTHTISAAVAYHSGGGIYTDRGELTIELAPRS